MVRARRRFGQLPTMTILLLALLATLPTFKVSSNTDTGNRGDLSANLLPSVAAQGAQFPVAGANSVVPPAGAASAMTVQRPVAQLIPPPDGLQSVSFALTDGDATRAQSGGAALIASGEYTANGRVITVNTFRADGVPASLGAQPIDLADGTPAWATVGPRGKATNQVALSRNGLVVTLSGDLPIDDLAALASRVVVRW